MQINNHEFKALSIGEKEISIDTMFFTKQGMKIFVWPTAFPLSWICFSDFQVK